MSSLITELVQALKKHPIETTSLVLVSATGAPIGTIGSAGATATFTGPVRTGGYTVATLPAGVEGDRAHVTDATAPTFLGALTGGGAIKTPVFYDGAAWVAG